jgi:MYXO-CTERM domain-containing protein
VIFRGAAQRGTTTIHWGATLVTESATGWSHAPLTINVAGDAIGGVNGFGSEVERVVLAVSVLGPSGAAPGAGGVEFGYEASLHEDVPLPDGGLPLPDAGPTPDAGPQPVDRTGGCGCRSAGSAPSLPLVLLIGLSLLAVRVRRRG